MITFPFSIQYRHAFYIYKKKAYMHRTMCSVKGTKDKFISYKSNKKINNNKKKDNILSIFVAIIYY